MRKRILHCMITLFICNSYFLSVVPCKASSFFSNKGSIGNTKIVDVKYDKLQIQATSHISAPMVRKKITEGPLSFEIPIEWEVVISPGRGAEFRKDKNMVGIIGYGKYDKEIRLESYAGNHVEELKITKLEGYNFTEAYRLDVGTGEPAASKTNKITRTVHYVFINKNLDMLVHLWFYKQYVDQNTYTTISKTIKLLLNK